MPRRQQDTVPERVAALETEFPHLRKSFDGLSDSVRELARRVGNLEASLQTLTTYARIALLLGTAGLVHVTGGPIGALAGRLARLLGEALSKTL